MKTENLTIRSNEIMRELNSGNTDNLQEVLKISFELCNQYEPCRCGFISKSKETGLCKICLENEN